MFHWTSYLAAPVTRFQRTSMMVWPMGMAETPVGAEGLAGAGVGVSMGSGSGGSVGGMGVSVGGMGVSVGGMGVSVGGMGVSVVEWA